MYVKQHVWHIITFVNGTIVIILQFCLSKFLAVKFTYLFWNYVDRIW